MRNWFVGCLFAVGMALYVYKGFSGRENVALNLAGVLAIGIAIFPMSWTCSPSSGFSMHGTCAVLFFLCITYVCVFCSRDTLKLIRDPKEHSHYKRLYTIVAIFMIGSPLIAFVLNSVNAQNRYLFLAELTGIYSFSAFWVIKSREIKTLGSEKTAIQGS